MAVAIKGIRGVIYYLIYLNCHRDYQFSLYLNLIDPPSNGREFILHGLVIQLTIVDGKELRKVILWFMVELGDMKAIVN